MVKLFLTSPLGKATFFIGVEDKHPKYLIECHSQICSSAVRHSQYIGSSMFEMCLQGFSFTDPN
jgi:uncharacterized protein YaaQ